MDAACRVTDVSMGHAISARVEDSTFGQAVDRVGSERFATAEIMMIDLLLERLAGPMTDKDKDKDKAVIQLWQALREERRRPAGRLASGGAAAAGPGPGLPASAGPVSSGQGKQAAAKEAAAAVATCTAEAATERAAEIARLISAVEARLRAAEAEDGKV